MCESLSYIVLITLLFYIAKRRAIPPARTRYLTSHPRFIKTRVLAKGGIHGLIMGVSGMSGGDRDVYVVRRAWVLHVCASC